MIAVVYNFIPPVIFLLNDIKAIWIGKANIDEDILMQILDTRVEGGGATKSETIFQFVAEPSDLKMWVKVPDYQDWVLVDVGELFTEQS